MNVVERFIGLAGIYGPPGGERAVADEVMRQLADLGLSAEEDDAGQKIGGDTGNLLVRIPPTGGRGRPIFLCSHLDTVPASLPIRPVIKDGVISNAEDEILGADNKAAVAVMLAAAAELVAGTPREHAGVELIFTVMEERRLAGAAAFDVERLSAEIGYVYDYTGPIGGIVRSAIGTRSYTIEVGGRAAHAGIEAEAGRSAVVGAVRIAADLPQGRIAPGGSGNVGTIQGGRARNVVADSCQIEGEIRAATTEQLQELVRQVEAAVSRDQEEGISAELRWDYGYEPYDHAEDSEAIQLAEAALQSCGIPRELIDARGASDANIFNQRGLACLNLANGMREIHTPNEWIDVESLDEMVKVTLALIDAAAKGAE